MNKKHIIIPSLIFSGVLLASTMSNAYALYTQPNNSVSFGISQETEYYLKGDFNDWEQSNTYKFVNNTAGMTPEEHKIKEYKLENIPLNKNAELKVWGNNNAWFADGSNDCSYSHRWLSNAIAYSGDRNYIVPMSSNSYSFYLKFYDDDSSSLYITANKDILFFTPSSSWKIDDATFKVEQFSNSSEESSVGELAGTTVDTDLYKFEIGTTNQYYRFLRKSDDGATKWNQSNIQSIGNDDINNCFTLNSDVWSDWDADGSHGSWSAK